MRAKLILSLTLLFFTVLLAFPAQARDYEILQENNIYYQSRFLSKVHGPLTFRVGVENIQGTSPFSKIISRLTPRAFADYLWDYHPQDMIGKGWASTSDLPDTSNPYAQYKGTPYTVYQHIFNNTQQAANMTEQYHWGMPISCGSVGNSGNPYCDNPDAYGTSAVPAGHYWRIGNLAGVFADMAKEGYTQTEMEADGIYAGFDASFTMNAILATNSNTRTYYTSIAHGDVDPAIYGTQPFIMTFTIPVWSLISSGPPADDNMNSQPANPSFGKIFFGWHDVFAYCGTDQGNGDTGYWSAGCWTGLTPSYFIVPTEIAQKLGTGTLTFIDSTTRRFVSGSPIVKDINSMLNGQGDNNICFAPVINDYGCVTLDQYKTYVDDIQKLSDAISSWEGNHHIQLIWSGIPVESTIQTWVSHSQILDPYSATLTAIFHDPQNMASADSIAENLQSNPYVHLTVSYPLYANFLYSWLQNYGFLGDHTNDCTLLKEDYPQNSFIQTHQCAGKETLQAIYKYISSQGVDSSLIDQALSQGEALGNQLNSYSLSNAALSIGLHITYLWNGCNGYCTNSFDQNANTKLFQTIANIAFADFPTLAATLSGRFFYNIIRPYAQFLYQLGSEYWTSFQKPLKDCTSNCQLSISTIPSTISFATPQNAKAEQANATVTATLYAFRNTTATQNMTATMMTTQTLGAWSTATVNITRTATATNSTQNEVQAAVVHLNTQSNDAAWFGQNYPLESWIMLGLVASSLAVQFVHMRKHERKIPNRLPRGRLLASHISNDSLEREIEDISRITSKLTHRSEQETN